MSASETSSVQRGGQIPVEEVWAMAALVAITLALFAEGIVLGKVPAVRDMTGWTIPTRFLWRQSVLSGHLPAWDPYGALGTPMFAATVRGAVYPGHLLLLVGSFATGLVLTWVVHALVPAVGGYVLARRCGCRPATALLSGIVWLAGGYAVSMWYNGDKVLSGAWIPWAVVALHDAMRSPRWLSRPVAAAAAMLALVMLAGDVFFVGYALLLALPVMVGMTPDAPAGRAATRALGLVGIAAGLALLLAAPSLVSAEMLRGGTERSAPFSREVAEVWSMHPAQGLELLAPGALGDPRDLTRYPGGAYAADPTVQALPWAVSLYSGVGVLVFAVAAGRRRLTLGLAAVAAVSILAALGSHTPFDAVLRRVVWPLAFMRYPEKHVVVAIGALALLSALGAERLVRREARLAPALVAAASVGPLALLLAPSILRQTVAHGLLHSVAFAALAVGGVVAARRRPALALLLPCVVAIDLVLASRPLLAWIPPSDLTDSPFPRALSPLDAGVPHRIFRPRNDSDFDVLALPDGAAALYGIAAFPGSEPGKAPATRRLVEAMARAPDKIARTLRIDALLLPDAVQLETRFRPLRAMGLALYPLSPMPRAWMVRRAETLDDDRALSRLVEPGFDPELEAVVSSDSPPASASLQERGNAGACAVASFEEDRVDLRCRSTTPALVVLAEQWGRGWTAEIDGTPTAVARVDVVLRGVAVDAGAHEIVFRYAAPGWRAGLALGCLGLLLCAAIVARPGRRPGRYEVGGA